MKKLMNMSTIIFIFLLELTIASVSDAAEFTTNELFFIEIVEHEISIPVSVNTISSQQVRHIVRNHLNPQMSKKLSALNGVSLWGPATDNTSAFQIALLDLVYPNTTAALRAQQQLPGDAYFKVSKISTPFSSSVIDNHLFVVFTETASNQQALELIKYFPEKWNKKGRAEAFKE